MRRDARNVPGKPHRVYHPGQRHMELMPSLSRSSGLEKDGDSLKDPRVQEEYRNFIQTKLDDYWKQYPPISSSTNPRKRDEVQENLLILFRKLREGLLATSRVDTFALEAYETSLYLSIIFGSPAQTTSIISHLLPKVYLAFPKMPEGGPTSALLSCLHFLVAGYPSQSRYHEHLDPLRHQFISGKSSQEQWLSKFTRSLRFRNYATFEALTSRDVLSALVPLTHTQPRPTQVTVENSGLAFDALCTLVDTLKAKARETTWLVLRSAYRELHCPVGSSHTNAVTTSAWLCRSLALRPTASTDSSDANDDSALLADTWLKQKNIAGEIKLKEGATDRWIVCKVKV